MLNVRKIKKGRLLTSTDPRGGVESFTYGDNGKIATAADKLGNTTAYEYHHRFRDSITKITSPAPFNYEAVFTYDSETGSLLTKTTPSGKTTTNTYYTEGAKKGLLHTVTDPNGNAVTLDYDLYGNLTTITDALSKETTMTYDSMGRVKTVTDALGNTVELWFDIMNNTIKMKDPLGNETQSVFDCLNRLIATINPESRSALLEYDSAGNIIKTTDAAGNFTQFLFDIFDNKTQITDQMGRVYKFEYDAKNRITLKRDPLGRMTRWTHDPYCGTTTKTDAMGQVTKIYTDLLCNVTRQEFENQNAFNIAYDELGRKISVTAEGPKYGDILYGGATGYGEASYGAFKYDTGETYYGFNPDETKTYTYDADDRILKIGFDGDLEFLYQYDTGGRLTQVTDVNGIVTQYEYSDRNDRTVIRQGSDEFLYVYDDSRRVTSVTYPNGIVKELTYDGASRVTQIKYSKDSETLIQLAYRFDPSGNITRRTETRKGKAPVEYGYFYDELSRLIRVDINGRTVSRYEYDPAGNRLKKEFAINRYAMQTFGGLKGNLKFDTIEYAYDAANQIISAGDTVFRHDMNGNMIEKIETWNGTDESGSGSDSGRTSTRYHYNRADRLRKITLPDGTHIKNYYDYEGLRTTKTAIDGKTTKYYWDVNASIPVVLSERDGLSNPVSSYAYNGFSPLLFKAAEPGNQSFSTAENRYYLNDHLSSILALSNEEAIITDQYDYDEYGIPVISAGRTPNTNGYTGQDYDDRTGLLYLRARYYEPQIGMFVKTDPITPLMNFYRYANNNPILFIDPKGETPCEDTEPVSPGRFMFVCVVGAVATGITVGAVSGIPFIAPVIVAFGGLVCIWLLVNSF